MGNESTIAPSVIPTDMGNFQLWEHDRKNVVNANSQVLAALEGKGDFINKSDTDVTKAFSNLGKITNQVAAKNNELYGGQNAETGQYFNAVTRMVGNTVFDKQGNIATARLMDIALNIDGVLGQNMPKSDFATGSQNEPQNAVFGNVGTVNIFGSGTPDTSSVAGMAQQITLMIDSALDRGGKSGDVSTPATPKTVGDTGLMPGESKTMKGMEMLDFVTAKGAGGLQYMPEADSISIGPDGIDGSNVLTIKPPEGAASSVLTLEGLEDGEAADLKIKTADGKTIQMHVKGDHDGKVDIPINTDAAEIELMGARGTESDFTLSKMKITADDMPLEEEAMAEDAIAALGDSTKVLANVFGGNRSGMSTEMQRAGLGAVMDVSRVFSDVTDDTSDLGFGVSDSERDELLDSYRGVLALIGQSQSNSPDLLEALTGVKSSIGDLIAS